VVFPVALAQFAVDELGNLIKDTGNAVSTGGRDFINTGSPDSLIGRLQQETGRQACRKWAYGPRDNPPEIDAQWDNFCRPYLESIGEYPGEPAYDIPFDGGQCDFVYEEIRFSSTSRGNASGPVPGLNPVFLDIDNFQGPLQSFTLQNRGELGSFVRAIDGNGNPRDSDDSNFVYAVGLFSTDPDVPGCGDPDPQYEPSGRPPGPNPGPRDVDLTPDINVDIDVDINPGGDITVTIDPGDGSPITVDTDPFSDPDGPMDDPGEPGPPVDTGEGGDAEGSDPDRILVGVLVDAITIPNDARIATGEEGPLYIGPAWVYLGMDGRLDRQNDSQYVRFPQFFYAPQPSDSFRVTARTGYNLRVTPFYREKES
jgi:hypothetical protein